MFHAKRYVDTGIEKLVIDKELVNNPKSLV